MVSVEGLPAGTQILAGQVELPTGSTLVTDPEALVVNITAQVSQAALDAELGEVEEGAEPVRVVGSVEAVTEAAAEEA